MNHNRRHNIALSLALVLAAGLAGSGGCKGESNDEPHTYQGALCSESSAGDLFQRKIAPLLADDRPSSCNECHLSGIDLGMFVGDSACSTMACMVDQNMVDLQQPERSQILTWIKRADPKSPLITQEVIDQEYDGVLDWIQFHSACGSDVCSGAVCSRPELAFCPTANEPDAAASPSGLGCDDKDIEQLFLDSVYKSRGRCSPCHFDNWDKNNIGSPPWIHTGGTCNQASLATLRDIERRGYINVDQPDQSLMMLKPLSIEGGGVVHGGGEKFHAGPDDSAYLNFMRFLEHYSECKRGTFDGGARITTPPHDAAVASDAAAH